MARRFGPPLLREHEAHHRVDKDWTKEETDYLFSIATEYDLRFYIIADRYDFPGGQPRTVEVYLPFHKSVFGFDLNS